MAKGAGLTAPNNEVGAKSELHTEPEPTLWEKQSSEDSWKIKERGRKILQDTLPRFFEAAKRKGMEPAEFQQQVEAELQSQNYDSPLWWDPAVQDYVRGRTMAEYGKQPKSIAENIGYWQSYGAEEEALRQGLAKPEKWDTSDPRRITVGGKPMMEELPEGHQGPTQQVKVFRATDPKLQETLSREYTGTPQAAAALIDYSPGAKTAMQSPMDDVKGGDLDTLHVPLRTMPDGSYAFDVNAFRNQLTQYKVWADLNSEGLKQRDLTEEELAERMEAVRPWVLKEVEDTLRMNRDLLMHTRDPEETIRAALRGDLNELGISGKALQGAIDLLNAGLTRKREGVEPRGYSMIHEAILNAPGKMSETVADPRVRSLEQFLAPMPILLNPGGDFGSPVERLQFGEEIRDIHKGPLQWMGQLGAFTLPAAAIAAGYEGKGGDEASLSELPLKLWQGWGTPDQLERVMEGEDIFTYYDEIGKYTTSYVPGDFLDKYPIAHQGVGGLLTLGLAILEPDILSFGLGMTSRVGVPLARAGKRGVGNLGLRLDEVNQRMPPDVKWEGRSFDTLTRTLQGFDLASSVEGKARRAGRIADDLKAGKITEEEAFNRLSREYSPEAAEAWLTEVAMRIPYVEGISGTAGASRLSDLREAAALPGSRWEQAQEAWGEYVKELVARAQKGGHAPDVTEYQKAQEAARANLEAAAALRLQRVSQSQAAGRQIKKLRRQGVKPVDAPTELNALIELRKAAESGGLPWAAAIKEWKKILPGVTLRKLVERQKSLDQAAAKTTQDIRRYEGLVDEDSGILIARGERAARDMLKFNPELHRKVAVDVMQRLTESAKSLAKGLRNEAGGEQSPAMAAAIGRAEDDPFGERPTSALSNMTMGEFVIEAPVSIAKTFDWYFRRIAAAFNPEVADFGMFAGSRYVMDGKDRAAEARHIMRKAGDTQRQWDWEVTHIIRSSSDPAGTIRGLVATRDFHEISYTPIVEKVVGPIRDKMEQAGRRLKRAGQSKQKAGSFSLPGAGKAQELAGKTLHAAAPQRPEFGVASVNLQKLLPIHAWREFIASFDHGVLLERGAIEAEAGRLSALERARQTVEDLVKAGAPKHETDALWKKILEEEKALGVVEGDQTGILAAWDGVTRAGIPGGATGKEIGNYDSTYLTRVKKAVAEYILQDDFLRLDPEEAFNEIVNIIWKVGDTMGFRESKDRIAIRVGQAMIHGASQHRLVGDISKLVGPGFTPERAKALNSIFDRVENPARVEEEIPTEAIDTMWEDLEMWGLAMSTDKTKPLLARLATLGDNPASSMANVSKKLAALPNAPEGWVNAVPWAVLKGGEADAKKLVKEMERYHDMDTPLDKAHSWLDFMLRGWRVSAIIGLLAPGLKHMYGNTPVGDFSQQWDTMGITAATGLSSLNALTMVPFWGRKMQDAMLRRGPGLFDSTFSPSLDRAFRMDDGLALVTRNGERLTGKQLRDEFVRGGVYETQVLEDLNKIAERASFRAASDFRFAKLRRIAEDYQATWQNFMVGAQIRQRAMVYSLARYRGASPEAAREAVMNTLYDWAHPAAQWELNTFAKISAFWTFWRNAFRQDYLRLTEATKGYGPMPIVNTRLSRVRQMVGGHDMLANMGFALTEEYSDEEFETQMEFEMWRQRMQPWWMDTRLILRSRMLPHGQAERIHDRIGVKPTHTIYTMPAFTPIDSLSYSQLLIQGLYGYALALDGDENSQFNSEAYWDRVGETGMEMLMPQFQIAATEGLGGYSSGRKTKLRYGEHSMVDLPLVRDIAGVRNMDVDNPRERGANTWFIQGYRLMPGLMDVSRYAAAFEANPHDPMTTEGLSFAIRYLTGLGAEYPWDPLQQHAGEVKTMKTILEEKVTREKERAGLVRPKEQ